MVRRSSACVHHGPKPSDARHYDAISGNFVGDGASDCRLPAHDIVRRRPQSNRALSDGIGPVTASPASSPEYPGSGHSTTASASGSVSSGIESPRGRDTPSAARSRNATRARHASARDAAHFRLARAHARLRSRNAERANRRDLAPDRLALRTCDPALGEMRVGALTAAQKPWVHAAFSCLRQILSREGSMTGACAS